MAPTDGASNPVAKYAVSVGGPKGPWGGGWGGGVGHRNASGKQCRGDNAVVTKPTQATAGFKQNLYI